MGENKNPDMTGKEKDKEKIQNCWKRKGVITRAVGVLKIREHCEQL